MTYQVGYCTNVHAGPDFRQLRHNLERFALAVRHQVAPHGTMGVGLWFAATAAQQCLQEDGAAALADWLASNRLLAFTLNGFPQGDFHQPVVKHAVYLPTWADPQRARFTQDLTAVLHHLLPAGLEGSISTLPIAWGTPAPADPEQQAAAGFLAQVADGLHRLEQDTGRRICLCLEPEPGCVLQYSADVVAFFERFLLPGRDEHRLRRYLGVCHDVCHAAVMFEGQAEVLDRYRRAGLTIGKIQVSAAVALPLGELSATGREAALAQLAAFQEPRYLHQTLIRFADQERPTFFEDLPLALAAVRGRDVAELRTHFHVPIYLERFGHLHATQAAIRECLAFTLRHDLCRHFEVETYAWGVLPPELRQPDLAAGIVAEMNWCRGLLDELSGPPA